MNIAIITARGGSKRISHKNIRDFCGKPIIEYSIRAALDAQVFDTVMVSTDDERIEINEKNAGAEVPFMRSEKTANDYATTTDVLLEVIEQYDKMGITFENACCIYPTAPFVNAAKLKNAMAILQKDNRHSVMPVTAFSFPPLRGMTIKDDKLEYKWPEYAMTRSQDLEEIYHDCGQFYAFQVASFIRERKLVTDNTAGIVISELEVQDIDNEVDWELAEAKYRLLKEKGKI